jgi:hypothetical protein
VCQLQHKLTGFYDRDAKCLLCGTDWAFKYSSLRFVFKGLKVKGVGGVVEVLEHGFGKVWLSVGQ